MPSISTTLKEAIIENALTGVESGSGGAAAPAPAAGTTLRYPTAGGVSSYGTITAALAAASSGDVCLVGPGTYAESFTIPDGVRVIGYPLAQQVIISGSDTTSTRVTISGTTSQSRTVQFEFSIPDTVAGNLIAFKFGRVGGDASDTYTGNIDVGLIEANGYAWTV